MKPTIDIARLCRRLTHVQVQFVCEYVQDFAARRAAETVGLRPDAGYALLELPEVQQAVQDVHRERTERATVDSDWLLSELVDNHHLARHQGAIAASNTALKLIGRHRAVDAFAADKLDVVSDRDLVDRLHRGRAAAARAARGDDEPDAMPSFI